MSKSWFRPKRYGYGAGLPVSWQGWAVLAVYVGALVILYWFAQRYFAQPQRVMIQAVGVLIATAALVLICAAKTEGGWRWRWGDDD